MKPIYKKLILATVVIGGGYLLYSKVLSAAPALPASKPPTPAGDHVSQTSNGALTTTQAQTMLKVIGAIWLASDIGDPTMAGHVADDNALVSLGVDGDFGGASSHAVSVYQDRKGLNTTGQVDPATAAALKADASSQSAQGFLPYRAVG
jgi:peptidoglycan hydrolase-like protein with peptidoglycan-binding domain